MDSLNLLAEHPQITLYQVGALFGIMLTAMGGIIFGILRHYEKKKNGNPGNSPQFQTMQCGLATVRMEEGLKELSKAIYALKDELVSEHNDYRIRHVKIRGTQKATHELLKSVKDKL